MKEKLIKIKDKYLKAEYVIPGIIGGTAASITFIIGYSKGFKHGVTNTFNGLSNMIRDSK